MQRNFTWAWRGLARLAVLALVAIALPAVAGPPLQSFTLHDLLARHPLQIQGQTIAAPPTKPGCYRFSNGVWTENPCASKDFIRRNFPHPGGDYVTVAEKDAPPNKPPTQAPIGYVQTNFSVVKYGSETDNNFGADHWSLQLNSNSFIGNNGDTDWVQFVQHSTAGGGYGFCVWNIDFTKGDYYSQTQCASSIDDPVPVLSPGANATYQVLVGTDSLMFVGLGTSQGGAGWAVISTDAYGLRPNFAVLTAAIVGYGGGSHATFSNTCLQDFLYVDNATSDLRAELSNPVGVATLETGNLQVVGTPTLSCDSNGCSVRSNLRTPDESCFQPPPPPKPAVCSAVALSCGGEVSISCTGDDVGLRYQGSCKDQAGHATECVAGFNGASHVSIAPGTAGWTGTFPGPNPSINVCTEANGQQTCQTYGVGPTPTQSCPTGPSEPPPRCFSGLGSDEIWCARMNKCVTKPVYDAECTLKRPTP